VLSWFSCIRVVKNGSDL